MVGVDRSREPVWRGAPSVLERGHLLGQLGGRACLRGAAPVRWEPQPSPEYHVAGGGQGTGRGSGPWLLWS